MNENNRMIANALSLRTPQRKSLDLLVEQIVQKITLKSDILNFNEKFEVRCDI